MTAQNFFNPEQKETKQPSASKRQQRKQSGSEAESNQDSRDQYLDSPRQGRNRPQRLEGYKRKEIEE